MGIRSGENGGFWFGIYLGQAKLVRFESTRASPLQAYPRFGLNPGDMTGTQDIDRGLLTTRAFGPFCRSENAQSTTQPWNTDTLSMGESNIKLPKDR